MKKLRNISLFRNLVEPDRELFRSVIQTIDGHPACLGTSLKIGSQFVVVQLNPSHAETDSLKNKLRSSFPGAIQFVSGKTSDNTHAATNTLDWLRRYIAS